MRKFNQPKSKRTSSKPNKSSYTSSFARTTVTEEEATDNDDEDEDDVSDLVIRTSKLDENKREAWVQEMKSLGINF